MANGLLALLSALNGYGQGNLWRQQENERRAEERAAQAKGDNSAPAVPTAPKETVLGDRLARKIVPDTYHHHVFPDMLAPLPSYGPLWQGQRQGQDDNGDDETDRLTPYVPASHAPVPLYTPASHAPAPFSPSDPFAPDPPSLMSPRRLRDLQAAMPSPSNGLRTTPGLAAPFGQPASRIAAGYSPPMRSASGLPMQSRQATFLHEGMPVTYTVTG